MEWVSLLKDIGLWLLKTIGRKKKTAFLPSNVFSDSIQIGRIARELIFNHADLNVDCCFVMLAHNGGKKLKPAGLKYRSIVGGDHNIVTMPRFNKENYLNLTFDYTYEELLSDIYESQNIRSGTVRELGIARTSLNIKFIFEGLKLARYYFIHWDKREGMYYLMIGTTHDNEPLNKPNHEQEFSFAINKIRNLIKKYR